MKSPAIVPVALAVIFAILLLLRKFRKRLFPTTRRSHFAMRIDDFLPSNTPGRLIVSGVVFEGEVQTGDSLVVETRYGRMAVHVETIEIERPGSGRFISVDAASQGDAVNIAIKGIHKDQISVHDLLLDPKSRSKNARLSRSGAPGTTNQFSDPTRPTYKPGQVYTYRTRPSEKRSLLTVLKVESYGVHTVVHVHLSGVSIQNSAAPDGVSTFISHMPFAEEAIDRSVTQLVEQKPQLPDFEEGYANWKERADQGRAGVFTIPVAQAIDGIEKAFQQGGERSGRRI